MCCTVLSLRPKTVKPLPNPLCIITMRSFFCHATCSTLPTRGVKYQNVIVNEFDIKEKFPF